jgi:hypothetical protein
VHAHARAPHGLWRLGNIQSHSGNIQSHSGNIQSHSGNIQSHSGHIQFGLWRLGGSTKSGSISILLILV